MHCYVTLRQMPEAGTLKVRYAIRLQLDKKKKREIDLFCTEPRKGHFLSNIYQKRIRNKKN